MRLGKAEPDWEALRNEVYGAFSPGAPIKIEADLAGREEQASRLRNIMLGAGEDALIYGERGVGKTSIALTFWLSLNTATRRVFHVHVNCGGNVFSDVWRKVFRRMRVLDNGEQRMLDSYYEGGIAPDDVEVELSSFMITDLPVILLDEFDKVQDAKTKSQMVLLAMLES